MTEYEKRKQWFLSKVGKTIYRTKDTCGCKSCTNSYKKGVFITDKHHAIYIHDIECETDLKYFETIEERNKYEQNILKNEK